ncbi:hypothetical protein CW748_05410 [Alteromonadales bacterium alter-6D02]|nr:hypothetical protein CW748_05410 [Alteromonadales bacterium alter-6D02]
MLVSIGVSASVYATHDDVVIVAHYQQGELKLTKSEISNLFMGGVLKHGLTPVALPPENLTRVLFNTKVIGLTESRIQSYWAQMRFSGRKKPPQEFKTEAELLQYIEQTPGTIAYLSAKTEIPEQLIKVYSTVQF